MLRLEDTKECVNMLDGVLMWYQTEEIIGAAKMHVCNINKGFLVCALIESSPTTPLFFRVLLHILITASP